MELLADELVAAWADPAYATDVLHQLRQVLVAHCEATEEVLFGRAVSEHRDLLALLNNVDSVDDARHLAEQLRSHGTTEARLVEEQVATLSPEEQRRLGFGLAAVRRNVDEHAAIARALAHSLSPDSCTIDVGCNRGLVLRDIVRHAPHGHHIAYEPIPSLAQSLRRDFPTVDIREAALSDRPGQATFVHVSGLDTYSGLSRSTTPPHISDDDITEITVRTERLDDALPPHLTPTLIKVDVEGAEDLVFQGATETLARTRPLVLFEHAATPEAPAQSPKTSGKPW
jgi:FkbM family methyltransferase